MAVSYRRRAAELCDARAERRPLALELWRQVFAAAGDEQPGAPSSATWCADDPAGLGSTWRRSRVGTGGARPRPAPRLRGGRDALPRPRRRAAPAPRRADRRRRLGARHDDLLRLDRGGRRPRAAGRALSRAGATAQATAELPASTCAPAALELARGRRARSPRSCSARPRAVARATSGRASGWPAPAPRRRAGRSGRGARRGGRAVRQRRQSLRRRCASCRTSAPRWARSRPRARAALERALSLRPDDVCRCCTTWPACTTQAATGRAPSSCATARSAWQGPTRRRELLLEIGGIEESQRRDDAAALAAYERVARDRARLAGRARGVRAAAPQGPAHGGAARRPPAAASTASPPAGPQARRSSLEIAQLAEQAGEGTRRGCIAAYRDALAIDRRQRRRARRDRARWPRQPGAGTRWSRPSAPRPRRPANLRSWRTRCRSSRRGPSWPRSRLKQIAQRPRQEREGRAARATWPSSTRPAARQRRRRGAHLPRALAARRRRRGRRSARCVACSRPTAAGPSWPRARARARHGPGRGRRAPGRAAPPARRAPPRPPGKLARGGAGLRGRASSGARARPTSRRRSTALEELYEQLGRDATCCASSSCAPRPPSDRPRARRAVRPHRRAQEQPRRHRRRARRVHAAFIADPANRDLHRDGDALLQRRALGGGDGALRRARSRSSRAASRAPTASAICTRAAARSSSSTSASSARPRRSYQQVIELDPTTTTALKLPRGDLRAAERLARADQGLREARRR